MCKYMNVDDTRVTFHVIPHRNLIRSEHELVKFANIHLKILLSGSKSSYIDFQTSYIHSFSCLCWISFVYVNLLLFPTHIFSFLLFEIQMKMHHFFMREIN